ELSKRNLFLTKGIAALVCTGQVIFVVKIIKALFFCINKLIVWYPNFIQTTNMSGDAGKVLEDIDGFDKQKLRHVETEEKFVLPNNEVIQKEKTEKQLMQEIETGPSLKPTETKEKIPFLPKKI
ncbi:unnamed protein product, partial [Heterobilharzia americana]